MKDRIIKTIVPYVVGWIGANLSLLDIVMTAELRDDVTNALTLIIGSLYYILVVLLTKHWPQLEILLGSTKKPVYKETK